MFQAIEYGPVTSSAPRFAPSNLNCTPATRTLSLAQAVTVTDPAMVAPPAGELTHRIGAVVSGGVDAPIILIPDGGHGPSAEVRPSA